MMDFSNKTLVPRPLFWRKVQDRLVEWLSWAALAIALGAMVWILITIVTNGLQAMSWEFLSHSSKPYGVSHAGIANALLGTLYITLVASVIAVPLALAAGIGLSEYGHKSKFASWLRFCANVLMGVPSVIVGLFIYVVLVVPMGGFSGLAGAIALSILMFPVVMRTTEDMLRMVPDTLRESGLALGLSRTRVTLSVVCRSARNGLLTGILLSVARVSGETAPLLFTVLFADSWPTKFFSGPTANLPVLITEYTNNSPFEEMHRAGWGAAFVITFLVLMINLIVRICFRERNRRS